MYNTELVLAAIDRNAFPILALCSAAMACNYIYFIAAALRGFRDKVYPLPVFAVLFWLSGDGSVVFDYNLAFNVLNHWYVKLFWCALIFTVAFEVLYLSMIIRFGRKEIAPNLSQTQFTLAVLGGLVLMFVVYTFIKARMSDELFINYFNIANAAAPAFAWSLMMRRGSTAGTSPVVWFGYTGVCFFWAIALVLYFGEPFASPHYLALYAVTIIASLAVALKTLRMR